MVASMGQVTKNAEQSARAAQQVLEHLLASDRAVDASGQGMTRIDAAVSETAEKMRLLIARSREVFEIINLIEEIASRSELLSINAAIEAAHAGDAGKGFGVVADEIRHLADRSIEATRSVTDIVQGMAAETQAVRDAMETSMREVKQGLDLSEQARHGLSEISALVQQATDLAGQISYAVHEQTRANQTVAEAMQTIGNIAEQSSAGSKETARAVHDLVLLSEHLTKTIARFRIDRPEEHSTTAQASPATLDQIAQHLGRLVAHLNAGHAAPSPQADDGAENAQSLPTLARDLGQLVEQLRHKP
jgi:methyl-accepting chemotaxis protein